jgi:2-polyprenyl-6-methoxyphenol hydroxylase-like FAD-dependent oxidoreductase
MPEVIVVGGGPTGLWLAAELRLAGVSVDVLEGRPRRSPRSKAITLHARTLEVLAMRGLAGQFVDNGAHLLTYHFGMLEQKLPLAGLDSPFPFVLAHSQVQTEEKIERWALELGVNIRRGHTVTGVTQDEDGVTVCVTTPEGVEPNRRASFVVGCDGSRSIVRQAAGIDFVGSDPSIYGFLADVVLDDPPPPGFAVHSAQGSLSIVPLGPGRVRMYGIDPARQDIGELTFEELREYVTRLTGQDFGMRDATWLSRFTSATRVAAEYRRNRILLAGDAAHIHFPAGGVGLNIGIQDAMNLGWKLAAEVQGRAAPDLLDTYHAERHPVGEEVARHTLAQGLFIQGMTPEGLALRGLMNRLIANHPSLVSALAEELTGIDVTYPVPGTHPLTGARLPAPEPTLSLLSSGKPLLILGDDLPQSGTEAEERGFRVVSAPLGDRPAWADVAAVLVRPDGHVWIAVDRSPEADGRLAKALVDLPTTFG